MTLALSLDQPCSSTCHWGAFVGTSTLPAVEIQLAHPDPNVMQCGRSIAGMPHHPKSCVKFLHAGLQHGSPDMHSLLI